MNQVHIEIKKPDEITSAQHLAEGQCARNRALDKPIQKRRISRKCYQIFVKEIETVEYYTLFVDCFIFIITVLSTI